MEGFDSSDIWAGHDHGQDRPWTLEDLIDAAISWARAQGLTSATPSVLKKAMKPLVNWLCMGGSSTKASPPPGATCAGELYMASLDLSRDAVLECLLAAKTDGLVARHQKGLLDRAQRMVGNLLPLTLEATREGEDIDAATRRTLPRDRHGADGAIRDRSAMHARWRIIEHISTLETWPSIDLPLKSDRLLSARSGCPLTDEQVNETRTHAGTSTGKPGEQLDFAALLPKMKRIAQGLTSRDEVDDLVQDAAVRLITYQVTEAKVNSTSLRTTMRNLRSDEARRRARRPLLPGDDVLPDPEYPLESLTPIEVLTGEVTRAIHRAPTPEDGMTTTEQIARQIAIAVLQRVLGDDETKNQRGAQATLTRVLREEAERVSADRRAAAARRARLLLEIGASVVAGAEPPRSA